MFNVGGGELLVVLLVALIVLGPTKLPGAARQFGRVMSELRRVSAGFQREMREALDDPIEAAGRERGAAPKESTAAAAGMYLTSAEHGPAGDDASDEAAEPDKPSGDEPDEPAEPSGDEPDEPAEPSGDEPQAAGEPDEPSSDEPDEPSGDQAAEPDERSGDEPAEPDERSGDEPAEPDERSPGAEHEAGAAGG